MFGPEGRGHGSRGGWREGLIPLITFWKLLTTVKPTIESVPVNAAEGTDVLLLVHSVTRDLLGYSWYRGERVENNQRIASHRIDDSTSTTGLAHSGRETIHRYYTLFMIKNDLQTESLAAQLRVYPVLPTPVITSNNCNPMEQDTVVLTCGTETQNTSHKWWVNNRSLPNSTRLELSEDNRTLTLFHVTRNDTGPYMCETRNPVSVSRSDPFTLNVICSPTESPLLEQGLVFIVVHGLLIAVASLVAEHGLYVRGLQ
uniref:Ig-like domain-containing protein n=1 Tax=Phocoena sinus TaxID=42100 RepID=A0A8C9CK52_PHOSS